MMIFHKLSGILVLVIILMIAVGGSFAQDFVPFIIPGEANPDSLIKMNFEPIEVSSPRIVAASGHFYREDKRMRFWGTNTSFGGNLPAHDDAEMVAARLAAGGINCLRLHHMDTAWYPRGLWNSTDGKTISPEAMDRLDYFIAKLAEAGVYVNLNLHVGRKHSLYLDVPESNRDYDKICGIFTPVLVEAQKDFARTMLNHMNPYRGNIRYGDDPAIAIVEITNEDSFFMWSANETLQTLPTYYNDILQSQYNAWLLSQYGSDSELHNSWNEGIEPAGENILDNTTVTEINSGTGTPERWNIEQHGTARLDFSVVDYQGNLSSKLDIQEIDDVGWHLQMNQGGFTVEAGRYYTFSFDAASESSRQMYISAMMAHDPWSNLGLYETVNLEPQWKTYTFGFIASATDTNMRVGFTFGNDTPAIYITNANFHAGGQQGLLPGESLDTGTVELFAERESQTRILDRYSFLATTEKAYFDGMYETIKEDLRCGAMVTGTIAFGPLGLYAQSDMDFIDTHAYWKHPRFPGTPWDMNNWIVEQEAMTDYPESNTLLGLSVNAVKGKPFTVTEYNHPAPNDFQSECVPMIASFGAAQDWDGVWLYSYSHSESNWTPEYFNSFFDSIGNPAKWGFVRAGASIFLQQSIQPLSVLKTILLDVEDGYFPNLSSLHINHSGSMANTLIAEGGISASDLLKQQLRWSYTGGGTDILLDSQTEIVWDVTGEEGVYKVQGEGAWCYTGHATLLQQASGGILSVTSPTFASVTLTSLTGQSLQESPQILLTACGRAENQGMSFSEDRTTLVENNWGTAPAMIEAVQGSVQLEKAAWTAWALKADGTRGVQVSINESENHSILNISPDYQTMWYLLERDDLLNDNAVLYQTY